MFLTTFYEYFILEEYIKYQFKFKAFFEIKLIKIKEKNPTSCKRWHLSQNHDLRKRLLLNEKNLNTNYNNATEPITSHIKYF